MMTSGTVVAGDLRVGDRLHGARVYDVTHLQHDPGRVVVSAGRNGIGFAIVLDAGVAVPIHRLPAA